jgi:CheY-like chemotaxis protein
MSTKILLVVDIEMHGYVLLNRLRCKGFEVVIAQNRSTMMDMVYREKPNLILIDMVYPIKNMVTAIETIKVEETLKDIPILTLIKQKLTTDMEEILTIGCYDYELMPIQLPRLLEKINRLLLNSDSDLNQG